MGWSVTTNPERFDEAMAWFESRVPVTPDQYAALTERQQSQAVTIAAITEADMVADLLSEIQKAADAGEGIDVFRKRAKERMADTWTKATSHKLDAAFVTTMQTAYNAGRYEQLTDPDVMRTREFWIYDSVVDDRTTPNCLALDGFTAPADDPQWGGIYPPGHHLCRAGVRSQSRRQVERRGGPSKAKPEVSIPTGFGKLPSEPPWKPKSGDYPAKVWNQYKRKEREVRKAAKPMKKPPAPKRKAA